MREPAHVPGVILILLIVLTFGALGGFLYYQKYERLRRNERAAISALKVLATAEFDFRSNDRDGNQVNDFWTGDVAGLHHFAIPTGGGVGPIRLIPKEVATADAGPLISYGVSLRPYTGYFFVAMDTDEIGNLYRQDNMGIGPRGATRNASQFAFCAFPADYGRTGRWTYIINEGNTILKLDNGGKAVLSWPCNPVPPAGKID